MNGPVCLGILVSILVFGGLLAPLRSRPWPMRCLVVTLLTTATAILYQLLGTPAALAPSPKEASATQLTTAIAAITTELQAHPNADGWQLLGQVALAQHRFDEAYQDFRNALELQPDSPDLCTLAAQALLQGRVAAPPSPHVHALLSRALHLAPHHQRARFLFGVLLRQQGLPAQAIGVWTALLPDLTPSAQAALQKEIDHARTQQANEQATADGVHLSSSVMPPNKP